MVDSLPEGVVFLPAAGSRYGSYVGLVGDYGFYWSSTALDSIIAYCASFNSLSVYPDSYDDGPTFGYSVRLITECQ